jgi:hypothetical protein
MMQIRLYVCALYLAAIALFLGGIFAGRQLLRLIPSIGVPAFVGLLILISVVVATSFLLDLSAISEGYRRAKQHRLFDALVLFFVGFAIAVVTMWLNLVREFAPKLFIPVGCVLFLIMLLIAWWVDRGERVNKKTAKDAGVRRA